MHYEMLKHTGEYPIIGVNTFRNPSRRRDAGPTASSWHAPPRTRSTASSSAWPTFHTRHAAEAPVQCWRA